MNCAIVTDRFNVNGEMTPTLRKRIDEKQKAIGYVSYVTEDPEWVNADIPSLQVIGGIFKSEDEMIDFCVKNYRPATRPYNIAMRVRETAPSPAVPGLEAKLMKLQRERSQFLMEVAPWTRSSAYMICKGCSARLFLEGLRRKGTVFCPQCGNLLLSATNRKRLESFDARLGKLRSDLEVAKRGVSTGRTYWIVECCYNAE